MGYHIHHAIVVTSWDENSIRKTHKLAREIFQDELITEVTGAALNGFRSFLIAPDGSKEGWPESNEADKQREKFIEEMKKLNTFAEWVEISFGGDEPFLNTHILKHGNFHE